MSDVKAVYFEGKGLVCPVSDLPCRLILLLLLALPFISSHVCSTYELPESYCMESTIASKIPFKDLCSLCEKINNSPRQKKGEYLKKYVSYFRDYAKKMKQQSPFLVSTICTEFLYLMCYAWCITDYSMYHILVACEYTMNFYYTYTWLTGAVSPTSSVSWIFINNDTCIYYFTLECYEWWLFARKFVWLSTMFINMQQSPSSQMQKFGILFLFCYTFLPLVSPITKTVYILSYVK